jgi:hypothetical protein
MRITLEPTTDGRWQIWITEWTEDEDVVGDWGGTYLEKACLARVKELMRAASSAKLAELRKVRRALRS